MGKIMEGWRKGRIGRRKDGRINGCINGWMDTWMNRWGQTERIYYSFQMTSKFIFSAQCHRQQSNLQAFNRFSEETVHIRQNLTYVVLM